MNKERAMKSHFQHRALTNEWRDAFFALAKEKKIPPLKFCTITVHPVIKNRRYGGDVAYSVCPASKASQDGLVLAKVIPDDTPEYVRAITFYAPEIGKENALTLVITGEPA